MSGIRSFYRGPSAKGYASGASAPVRIDDTSNTLKAIVAGSGTTEVEFLPANLAPIQATAATLTVTAALHAGRTVMLNRAGGIAVTLPAATGTGNKYRFVVQTTFTGAAQINVANATDYFIGFAINGIDGGTQVPHLYPTANTGTVATESDIISLFGTANAQGGIKGQTVEIEDVASAVFQIRSVSDAAGTEATPFSAGI